MGSFRHVTVKYSINPQNANMTNLHKTIMTNLYICSINSTARIPTGSTYSIRVKKVKNTAVTKMYSCSIHYLRPLIE